MANEQLILILFSVIRIARGLENGSYTCLEKICFPMDYNQFRAPRLSGDAWPKVYANILLSKGSLEDTAYNDLKNVNVKTMVITYKPTLRVAWQDPRLRFEMTQTSGRQLDEYLLNKMWVPKITVSNRANKDKDTFDFGKVGKSSTRKKAKYILN